MIDAPLGADGDQPMLSEEDEGAHSNRGGVGLSGAAAFVFTRPEDEQPLQEVSGRISGCEHEPERKLC